MSDELNKIIKKSFDLIKEQKYKSAVELLYPNLVEFSNNIEIITQIANCYFLMDEIEQAEEYYEKAFEINNNSTLILDPLIEVKIKLEKYNEAEKYAQYYLNCEDKTYATQKYLETLTKIKNFEEIINFSEHNGFENFNSESYSAVALAIVETYDEEKDPQFLEKAFDYANKAIELDKNNTIAYCTIAQYYILKKDYEKIEDLFKGLPQLETSTEAMALWGYKKYITGDFEQAVACYSKALELDKNNEILYLNLVESYMQMGWLKEAEVIVKQGLALFENSIKLRISLANIYYMNNEFDKTLLTLAFISEHEPDNVEMNLLYAYSYAHQDNFVKAQEYAKKLEGKVDSSYIDVSFAKIYYNLGQREKAFEKFDEAIEKEPENINLLAEKVEYLLQEGAYEEAQNLYDKMIEINPNYVDAYFRKSFVFFYTGNLDEALKYGEKAVEMDCNDAEYQFNLAKIYEAKGDYDKAIDCAKFSLSITPDDISKYWFIGFMYLEKGEMENALVYYKEILAINPNDFSTLARIAKTLEHYDCDPEIVYDYYQKAFRVNPYDYDFIRKYSDFVIEHISAFRGIKILLNYKNFTDNKNLKIESKNRAKRIIRENKKNLSLKEKMQLKFA